MKAEELRAVIRGVFETDPQAVIDTLREIKIWGKWEFDAINGQTYAKRKCLTESRRAYVDYDRDYDGMDGWTDDAGVRHETMQVAMDATDKYITEEGGWFL